MRAVSLELPNLTTNHETNTTMSEPHDMPLIAAAKANEIITQLTKENSELRAKLERAEACGAEYRDEISKIGFYCAGTESSAVSDYTLKLLDRTQCGVGYLSPEKVKRLREFVKSVAEVAPEFLDDETGHFSKTCEQLLSETE